MLEHITSADGDPVLPSYDKPEQEESNVLKMVVERYFNGQWSACAELWLLNNTNDHVELSGRVGDADWDAIGRDPEGYLYPSWADLADENPGSTDMGGW